MLVSTSIKKEIRKHDLYTQFAYAATDMAIVDSRLNLDQIDHDRVGVVWGAGIGGLQTFFEEARSFEEERPRFSPFFYPKNDSQYCGRPAFNQVRFSRS